MKERLEEKILHSVTISEKELVWVKPGKEIYLDGKMFDIKSIRTENGICHITGLFDEEESFLVKQLEKARGSGEFSSHQWLVQFLQLFQSEVPDDLHQQMIATGNNRENELNENLTTIFLAIIFPPPQVV